ncbi:hypothetical protein [Alsobacter sp. R-9]
MSSESKQIRSALGHDRAIRRFAVLAMLAYGIACTSITCLQLAHL